MLILYNWLQNLRRYICGGWAARGTAAEALLLYPRAPAARGMAAETLLLYPRAPAARGMAATNLLLYPRLPLAVGMTAQALLLYPRAPAARGMAAQALLLYPRAPFLPYRRYSLCAFSHAASLTVSSSTPLISASAFTTYGMFSELLRFPRFGSGAR